MAVTVVIVTIIPITIIPLTKTIAGWWFQPTHLKNDGAKVSWDDEIPN